MKEKFSNSKVLDMRKKRVLLGLWLSDQVGKMV